MMKAGFAFSLIFLTVLIFAADGFLLPESWLNTVEPILLETNDVNGETQNDLPEGSHPVSAELSDHSRTDILFEGYPDTNGWYSDQNEYTHTNEWYSNMEDYLPVSNDENMDSFKPIIEWSTGSIEETGADRPDIQALDAQESQPEETITPEKSMPDPEESAVIPEKHNAEKNTASVEENATTPGKHNANVEENEATADTHTANAEENQATAETHTAHAEENEATAETHTAHAEENQATADTHTANAEENDANVYTHTANAEENEATAETHTANGGENGANLYTHTANAEENTATVDTHKANAEENEATAETHTANGEENEATADTHKANAEENEATMYTHTANGEENEANVYTHTANGGENGANMYTQTPNAEENTATVDTHKANAEENEATAEAQNVTPEEDTASLLIITSSPYESSTTPMNIIPRPTKTPSHAERTPTSKEIVPPKTIYHMQPINHTPSGTEKQSQNENSPTKAKSPDFNIEVTGKKPITSKGKTPVRAPNFICLHPGRFRDPFDCKKYYTCRQGKIAKGKVTAYHYECAQNMWFSNYYRKCVKFKPGICRDFSENKMHVMKRGRVK